jgi:hypothetical protein
MFEPSQIASFSGRLASGCGGPRGARPADQDKEGTKKKKIQPSCERHDAWRSLGYRHHQLRRITANEEAAPDEASGFSIRRRPIASDCGTGLCGTQTKAFAGSIF